jgi:hypothetical protein
MADRGRFGRSDREVGPPADIGYDRAGPGGWQSRPQGPHVEFGSPSNIGRDRAGGYGTVNDLRQLGNGADSFKDYINRGSQGGGGTYDIGDLPSRNLKDFLLNRFNRDTTTVPEGFRMEVPNKHGVSYGRLRPDFSNPFGGSINNNPIQPGYTSPGANIGGGWNLYEGAPEQESPYEYLLGHGGGGGGGDMDSGEYLASRYGGGLDDAAGMNDGARGMIEDAGFEVANLGTDKRTEKKLWAQAVNKLPVGTPQPQIIEEWEKLKADFYRRKYGE